MITVVGEALVDLVISRSGEVAAALGGAPFNTARAAGRLGADVAFVGALSTDRFGEMLAAQLVADDVEISAAPRATAPTTLAAAELDADGAATYRFYIAGTSAPQLTEVPKPSSGGGTAVSDVLFTGGLGLVLEPMASVVEEMVGDRSAARLAEGDVAVMLDINCRPPVIADRAAYLARVARMVAAADIVKVSDDDLAYLSPDDARDDAAARLLDAGAGLVLVTGGANGVDIVSDAGRVHVPAEPVEVVDTVGAGDTFDGALLAWLAAGHAGRKGALAAGLRDLTVVERAVRAANTAAGVACTRRGADPPTHVELGPEWWS